METISVPEVDEAELLKHLNREISPLACIALERREKGFDTTYDHFKYDYFGHPYVRAYPELVRYHSLAGEQRYDRPIVSSYSKQGSLVQVRETQGRNKKNRAADFFVVTANLHTRQTVEWNVVQATFTGRGDSLQAELIVSDQPFGSPEVVQELDKPVDPLYEMLARKIRQQKDQEATDSRTKVVLTSQGCWFCPAGQQAEPLAPIGELIQKVDRLYAKFGHLALLHVSASEAGGQLTDTIAA